MTTAKHWKVGTKLNLERALKIGDELGGHIVAGHVDGIAGIVQRDDLPDTARFELKTTPRTGALHRRQGLGDAGRSVIDGEYGA